MALSLDPQYFTYLVYEKIELLISVFFLYLPLLESLPHLVCDVRVCVVFKVLVNVIYWNHYLALFSRDD